MTEAQAKEFISARAVTQWAIVQPGVPLALDNEALPSSGSFAQLNIQHTASRQLTHGGPGTRKWLRMGVIYLRAWTPRDRGTASMSALMDSARTVFEGIDLGTGLADALTIEAGQTREVGTDGQCWMSACVFNFRYYETR